MARVTGIALDRVGSRLLAGPDSRCVGMLTYSVLVTLYLAYLGFAANGSAPLLWPAVVLARNPDVASRPRLVQATRGQSNLKYRCVLSPFDRVRRDSMHDVGGSCDRS